jgi:hypothetical protein
MSGQQSPARPSKRPPKPARSGEHPAVQAYRKKLDSVDEGVTAATGELDRALEQFLTDLKTPVPPKPEPASKP